MMVSYLVGVEWSIRVGKKPDCLDVVSEDKGKKTRVVDNCFVWSQTLPLFSRALPLISLSLYLSSSLLDQSSNRIGSDSMPSSRSRKS